MKVLLIDKNLVDFSNYQKWDLLSKKAGVVLRGITPATWVENARLVRFSDSFAKEFSVTPLPTVWKGKENRGFYLKGLSREMRRFKPDIIVCFEEPFSFFALQTTFLARPFASKAKLVFYSWDNRAKGKDYGYRPAFVYGAIERGVMKRADMLLTASEEGTNYFRSAYATPVRKLYFGVNVDPPQRESYDAKSVFEGLPQGAFVVGYAGRLLHMKGVDLLIRSLPLLRSNAFLVILGSGPDEQRLRCIASELSVESRVIFVPAVPSSQTKQIISKFGVLVLPSRTTKVWKEQFGRVLVEGMSLGIPVIGSDSGAIPDVIGEAGLIFRENEHSSLAEMIARLMSDEKLNAELACKGKARAQEFSSARFADRMHDLLLELTS